MRGRDAYWNRNREVSEETRKKISEAANGRPCSAATRKKMSELAVTRGFGGHTSKRKIWYTCKDGAVIFLQSSYEVKFATLLDAMNIGWCRPAPLAWIDSTGMPHRYYPDFHVGKMLFDTKNDYLIKKDAEKIRAVMEQNGVVIHVVSLGMITEEYIASVV